MIPILALSASIGPVVGQNLGAQKWDRVKKTIKLGMQFCLLWGIIQAVTLWVGADFLSGLFTEESESLSFSRDYLQWISLSLFGYSFVIIASAILNAMNRPVGSFTIIFARSLGVFGVAYLGLKSLGFEQAVIGAIFIANIAVGVFSSLLFKKM